MTWSLYDFIHFYCMWYVDVINFHFFPLRIRIRPKDDPIEHSPSVEGDGWWEFYIPFLKRFSKILNTFAMLTKCYPVENWTIGIKIQWFKQHCEMTREHCAIDASYDNNGTVWKILDLIELHRLKYGRIIAMKKEKLVSPQVFSIFKCDSG